jgi:LDH2 family malate/lactate/ureidoglycolate dehydrogenase
MVTVAVDELRRLTTLALDRAGLGLDDAQTVAEHLLDASLDGYEFTGFSKLPEIIAEIRSRKPSSPPRIISETPLSAVVDGGGRIGYVSVRWAMDLAIKKAQEAGFATVAVRNSYLSGRGAYHAEQAARQGLIGLHFAAAPPMVAPHGGIRPALGTNPLAIGLPCEPDPVVFDIGTSAIMFGEVQRRLRAGEPLPPGVAVDPTGAATTDPGEALQGALLPFGGHRGYGLALVVQALGLLSRSYETTGSVQDFGFLHLVLDPVKLFGIDDFRVQVRRLAEAVRDAGGPGTVLIPGDRGREARRNRSEAGVEVDDATLAAVLRLANERADQGSGVGDARQSDQDR